MAAVEYNSEVLKRVVSKPYVSGPLNFVYGKSEVVDNTLDLARSRLFELGAYVPEEYLAKFEEAGIKGLDQFDKIEQQIANSQVVAETTKRLEETTTKLKPLVEDKATQLKDGARVLQQRVATTTEELTTRVETTKDEIRANVTEATERLALTLTRLVEAIDTKVDELLPEVDTEAVEEEETDDADNSNLTRFRKKVQRRLYVNGINRIERLGWDTNRTRDENLLKMRANVYDLAVASSSDAAVAVNNTMETLKARIPEPYQERLSTGVEALTLKVQEYSNIYKGLDLNGLVNYDALKTKILDQESVDVLKSKLDAAQEYAAKQAEAYLPSLAQEKSIKGLVGDLDRYSKDVLNVVLRYVPEDYTKYLPAFATTGRREPVNLEWKAVATTEPETPECEELD